MKKERRGMELLCLSAEDRYRELLERSPELIQRVKQKDIARYLQVATRDFEYQDTSKSYIGFRCVRSYLGDQ